MIAALARTAKIKIVGMVFDKTPLNVFSSKDKAILKPKDLEGKTIAAPPGDSQRQVWPAFVKANQIDDSKVTWVNVEPAAKIAALAEKRVDAVADYTTGLPYYEKPMGVGNVVMMPWADFGLDMYSMSIMASEKTMDQKSKTLRAFLEAAYMGWRDVMADPKEALAIFKNAQASGSSGRQPKTLRCVWSKPKTSVRSAKLQPPTMVWNLPLLENE